MVEENLIAHYALGFGAGLMVMTTALNQKGLTRLAAAALAAAIIYVIAVQGVPALIGHAGAVLAYTETYSAFFRAAAAGQASAVVIHIQTRRTKTARSGFRRRNRARRKPSKPRSGRPGYHAAPGGAKRRA